MGMTEYLKSDRKKEKWPVGKIAGVDSHTYNGSHVMHILVEELTTGPNGETIKNWVLKCRPLKKGVYSFMGFRAAITCQMCKTGRGVKVNASE